MPVITTDTAWAVGWTETDLRRAVRDWGLPHRTLGQKISVPLAAILRAIDKHAPGEVAEPSNDVAPADTAEDLRLRAEIEARDERRRREARPAPARARGAR